MSYILSTIVSGLQCEAAPTSGPDGEPSRGHRCVPFPSWRTGRRQSLSVFLLVGRPLCVCVCVYVHDRCDSFNGYSYMYSGIEPRSASCLICAVNVSPVFIGSVDKDID